MSQAGSADTVLIRTAVDPSGASAGLEKVARDAKTAGDQVEKTFSSQSSGALGKFGGVLDGIGKKVGGLTSKLTASPVANGILQGVGLGAGMLAFNGIGSAIQSVLGFMGDALKMARDDAASVDHLTTSLKANVPAWNGNTSAIDDFIAKGQDLAFTDDDIRASLAALVARTHDVKKAMDLTRQAMDLARARNISLTAAAEALGKVYDGKVAAGAKAAGIAIDKNATSTQALAQIQAAAAGQAEKYADSDAGRAERAADKWGETQEKIGYALTALQGVGTKVIGVVADAVSGLIDGIGNLGTAFDNLHRFIDSDYKLSQDTSNALRDLADQYGLNYDQIVKFTDGQKQQAEQQQAAAIATKQQQIALDYWTKSNQNADATAQAFGVHIDEVLDAIRLYPNAALAAATATDDNSQAIADARKQLAPYLIALGTSNVLAYASAAATSQASTAQDEYRQAIHDRRLEQEKANEADSQTAKNIMVVVPKAQLAANSTHKLTASAIHDLHNFNAAWRGAAINEAAAIDEMGTKVHGSWKDMMTQVKADQAALALELKNGPGDKKDLLEWLPNAMKKAHRQLVRAEKQGNADAIQKAKDLVSELNAIWQQLNGTITMTTHVNQQPFTGEGTGTGRGPGGQGTHARAKGGPIWPGDWIVGENGPERMRILPSGRGYVWPNKGGGRGGTGGGSSTVRHEFGPLRVHVDGPVSPAAAREIGHGIGDVLREFGNLRVQPVGSAAG